MTDILTHEQFTEHLSKWPEFHKPDSDHINILCRHDKAKDELIRDLCKQIAPRCFIISCIHCEHYCEDDRTCKVDALFTRANYKQESDQPRLFTLTHKTDGKLVLCKNGEVVDTQDFCPQKGVEYTFKISPFNRIIVVPYDSQQNTSLFETVKLEGE